jgi:hypothetical protein
MVPGLAWLDDFCVSTGAAIDQAVRHRVVPSVTPLIYIVHISWQLPLSAELVAKVWNLFEIWAAKNDCVTQGKIISNSIELMISVIVKRRLGPTKNDHPAL